LQEEQDKLLTLMDIGAALATASSAARRQGSGSMHAASGVSDGSRDAAQETGGGHAGQEAFILSIASCIVHEERPDPTALTATLEQQR
jgi:hypothetical protein